MTSDEKKELLRYLSDLIDAENSNDVIQITQDTYRNAPLGIVLVRLATVSQALTNSKVFDFYVKHANGPLLPPLCFICNETVHDGKVHDQLPAVGVCKTCISRIDFCKKIHEDKQRIVESLTLVVEESKAQCGEPEEGCPRCEANNDVAQLIESMKWI